MRIKNNLPQSQTSSLTLNTVPDTMSLIILVVTIFSLVNTTIRCQVLNSDIINFNWESLSNPVTISSPENRNKYDYSGNYSPSNKRNDRDLINVKISDADNLHLESDFGSFTADKKDVNYIRRPRFQTQQYKNLTGDNKNMINSSNKVKINSILKNYLAKLYVDKYQTTVEKPPLEANKPKTDVQESKFYATGNGGSIWGYKNKTKSLKNKFLSLFQIVKFPNSQCTTSSTSGSYIGVCYHQTECSLMNGTAIGNCAEGYGVCCVFRYTCGGSSSQNCTYFESPGYPNYDPSGMNTVPPIGPTQNPSPTPDPRLTYLYNFDRSNFFRDSIESLESRQTDTSMSCSFSVYKTNNNIQQMRIDFIDLELAGPTNGTCVNERLVITGQNVNDQVPIICGYNTGQHVYVDVSMLTGPLQISVLSNTGQSKRFKIQVCQIANSCTNSNNCLQYYTGVTGMISSFNYDQAVVNRSVPGYFNNLNYAICIRKEAGYCSITYTNMPAGDEYPFQLTNLDDAGNPTTPPGQAGADIFNCPDDYIVIGGTRLCGDRFNDGSMIDDFTRNAPVTDNSAGPIVVQVRTNQDVTGRGFKLFYTQNRCT